MTLSSLDGSFLTGCFTLAGSLGGVIVSQRYTARLTAESRVEERRALIREHLGELSLAVGQLIDTADTIILFTAKATSADLFEFAKTDTVREMRETHQQIRRSLTALLLLGGTQPLRSALSELTTCTSTWADEVNGPPSKAQRTGSDPVEARREAMQHVRRTNAAMAAVVRTAGPVVQVEIPLREGARRWRLWLTSGRHWVAVRRRGSVRDAK